MFDRLSSFREQVPLDDEDLQQAILEKLQDDPAYVDGRRLRVSIDVDDGEVTATGSVRTALERRKVDIVARALGATTVRNEIVIDDTVETRRPARRSRRGRSAA
ncbi:MAG: BON domain-containing protein [Vicinamibacterales bacterium]